MVLKDSVYIFAPKDHNNLLQLQKDLYTHIKESKVCSMLLCIKTQHQFTEIESTMEYQ